MDIFDIYEVSTQIPQPPDFVSKQVVLSRYLFLELFPPDDARCILTSAGREECEATYHLLRDGFKYFAVELVVSGRCELSYGGEVFELGSGSVLTYGPETQFSLKAVGDKPLVKYFVNFAGDQAESLLVATALRFGRPQVLASISGVKDIMDQILDCQGDPKSVAFEMTELLTRLLLLRLKQDIRPFTAPQRNSLDTYHRCRDYLREHYLELHDVEGLSKACHITSAYLSRLFKKHAGEGPHQVLTRLKMEHAVELLRFQGFSVKEAGESVGYEDPFHFSRVFKKTFGASPQHFK